jgi:hypothetical protein
MSLSGGDGTYSGTVTIIPKGEDEPFVTDIRVSERKDGNFIFSSELLNGTLKYSKQGGEILTGKLKYEVFGLQASLKKVGN